MHCGHFGAGAPDMKAALKMWVAFLKLKFHLIYSSPLPPNTHTRSCNWEDMSLILIFTRVIQLFSSESLSTFFPPV